MRQSALFTKTERSFPKDETAANARFLERAGFVYKNSAGVYSYLPLGWRVIQKISQIVREEMDAIGGQEMLMAALHDKKYLTATGRWDVDVVFKVISGGEKNPLFNISWTHEEVMTEIASKYISSYKDLPFAAYQIQTKFRREPRAKSGLLRTREFIMKDLYSFHAAEADFQKYYEIVKDAYLKVFKRCGLKAFCALAGGGDFTANYTHEFQVLSPVGEDTIYLCKKCGYAENKEVSKLKAGGKCPAHPPDGQECGGKISEEKSIEVGNIFPLGTKYSEAFGLKFLDRAGEKKFVVMGSYGIGVSRLMAAIVEVHNDEKGIIWPESVAPFAAHLLELNGADGGKVCDYLQKNGIDVLYDDRQVSAGEKLVEADLIGLPARLVVSPQTGDKIEVKMRNSAETKLVSQKDLVKFLKS